MLSRSREPKDNFPRQNTQGQQHTQKAPNRRRLQCSYGIPNPFHINL
jgi:hypothetical protein